MSNFLFVVNKNDQSLPLRMVRTNEEPHLLPDQILITDEQLADAMRQHREKVMAHEVDEITKEQFELYTRDTHLEKIHAIGRFYGFEMFCVSELYPAAPVMWYGMMVGWFVEDVRYFEVKAHAGCDAGKIAWVMHCHEKETRK